MMRYRTLAATQEALRQGRETVTSLLEYYLERIAATQHLNIYPEVFTTSAQARAAALDAKWQQDPAAVGPLFGLVVSIKDVICYADHQVTAGSKILTGFRSLFSATAVERLLAADALIIGRTNCDEFAMGSTNETSVYGPTRNAADPSKVPGGSSGGAAVAVQADTCLVALGSDTGGSVRQPAAFCGVYGLKPTYGRISRHGLLAYGSSFDQIGILAHDPHTVAQVLEVIAGPDGYDATASQQPVAAYAQATLPARPLRVAYLEEAIHHPSLDPEIATACHQVLQTLEQDGHQIVPAHFDLLEYLIPAYYVLTTAEASSNLSRYDGVRFGYRSPEANSLEATYKRSRAEGFGWEVKRRIMLGTFVLSSGYYDAYYTKAQQVRRLIQDRIEALFQECDLLLLPAAPTTAWDLGTSLADPVAMYLADVFTVLANMTAIPGIAIPWGNHSNGLPVGLQLLAGRFEEGLLLAAAQHLAPRAPQV